MNLVHPGLAFVYYSSVYFLVGCVKDAGEHRFECPACGGAQKPMKTVPAQAHGAAFVATQRNAWCCNEALSRLAGLWPGHPGPNDASPLQQRSAGNGRV